MKDAISFTDYGITQLLEKVALYCYDKDVNNGKIIFTTFDDGSMIAELITDEDETD